MVPSALVYRTGPLTSEILVVRSWYLTRLGILMRWYHQLWYTTNTPAPMRGKYSGVNISFHLPELLYAQKDPRLIDLIQARLRALLVIVLDLVVTLVLPLVLLQPLLQPEVIRDLLVHANW
jgi:hypothetical protein